MFTLVKLMGLSRCTLRLEKIFCEWVSGFLFVSCGLFGFLYVGLGSVFGCLACACMLFSVKLQHSLREVWMLQETAVSMLV
jgi:hypothetical protein